MEERRRDQSNSCGIWHASRSLDTAETRLGEITALGPVGPLGKWFMNLIEIIGLLLQIKCPGN
jgi:hypothetical protein